MLKRPSLVIFDCDGVIVDSEMIHCEVISENLARYGLRLSPQECRATFAAGKMSTIGEKARALGARIPDDWVEEIYPLIFAELAKGVPLVPGVVELMNDLDRVGIPYCVASNGAVDKMKLMLDPLGLFERLQNRMFSAHVVEIWKPDPGLFLHAARAHGVVPDACLVIEDSRSGVAAAQAAGMPCLAYCEDHDGGELAGFGAIVFHEMQEVPALIGI